MPKTSNTKHSPTCTMRFAHKDPTCPRCQELLAGAPVRTWGSSRAIQDAQRVAEIRAHDCKLRGCLPICTFGDW